MRSVIFFILFSPLDFGVFCGCVYIVALLFLFVNTFFEIFFNFFLQCYILCIFVTLSSRVRIRGCVCACVRFLMERLHTIVGGVGCGRFRFCPTEWDMLTAIHSPNLFSISKNASLGKTKTGLSFNNPVIFLCNAHTRPISAINDSPFSLLSKASKLLITCV